jgi:hypothetical protein
MKRRALFETLALAAVLVAIPLVVIAAESSFANDIAEYDLHSLLWAMVMSLLGGALRTIFTLATDNRVVRSFWVETVKDSVVAIIAGILAYVVLEAFKAFKVLPVAGDVRLAIILFAGWSRMSFFGWLNRLGMRVTDSVNDRIASVITPNSQRYGGAPAEIRVRHDDPQPPAPQPPTTPPPVVTKPKPFKEL